MKALFAALLLCLYSPLALAADNPCYPPGLSPGKWEKGISQRTDVADISKEVPEEFRDVILYLDKLPLDTDEKTLVAGVRLPLSQTIRVIADSPMFVWNATAKNSAAFHLRVFYHWGCISKISFIPVSGEYYSRSAKSPVGR